MRKKKKGGYIVGFICVAAVIVIVGFPETFPDLVLPLAITFLLPLAAIAFATTFPLCPHCHRRIEPRYAFSDQCPYCGHRPLE